MTTKPTKKTVRARGKITNPAAAAADTYSNAPARLGLGTPNLVEGSRYPLTRLTHDYMLMISLYRSSWIVRKVIDVLAEDMLKDFPTLASDLKPEDVKRFGKRVEKSGTLAQMLTALKWGRLFGGAINLIVIKGHDDLSQPLELDDIDPGCYMGLIPLDRWSGVNPDAKLITDLDNTRDFGLPSSYTCATDAGQVKVHHSRVLRFTGRDLPNWERQAELYWGLSEVELIFEELKKRDYTSWNIVSLLTRAQIISITEPQLASMQSGAVANNDTFNRFIERMRLMSDSMNNQGLMILPKDGQVNNNTYSFGGVADVYNTFMLDVAGACEIPVSRLYGRTITGLGQSGEGDLQVYYDTVEQKRKREIGPLLEKLLPVICMSEFGLVPDDLDYSWPAVRTLSDKDRSELAKNIGDSVGARFNDGIIGRKTALMELKQSSPVTGMWSNITDEMIDKADDDPQLPGESGGGLFGEEGGEEDQHGSGEEEGHKGKVKRTAADRAVADADRPTDKIVPFHGLTLHIENDIGSVRSGRAADGKEWSVTFRNRYGYVEDMTGADGDSLDCFLGPHPESEKVFIIQQNDLQGEYDEDKVMLGYSSAFEAIDAYFSHYDRPATFFRSMDQMSIEDFIESREGARV